MRRVESFDPSDAVVDELGPVTRRLRLGCGGERIERRLDQLGAASTTVRADWDELVVRAVLHEAGGTCEGATDRWLAIAPIAVVAHEVAPGAKGVPFSERDERTRRRVKGTGDDPSVIVTPPAVRPLTAGVAAVELGSPWAACSVSGTIADRAPPSLDDVFRRVSNRSHGLVGAHARSLIEGCDGSKWPNPIDDLGQCDLTEGRSIASESNNPPVLMRRFADVVNRLMEMIPRNADVSNRLRAVQPRCRVARRRRQADPPGGHEGT